MSETQAIETAGNGRSLVDEPRSWLTGGMLALSLWMVIGILSLICYYGLAAFWPRPIHLTVLADGTLVMGEPVRTRLRATLYDVGGDVTGERRYLWVDRDASLEPICTPEAATIVDDRVQGRLIGLDLAELVQDAENLEAVATDDAVHLALPGQARQIAESFTLPDASAGIDGLPDAFTQHLAAEGLIANAASTLVLGQRSLLFVASSPGDPPRVFIVGSVSALEGQIGVLSVLQEMPTLAIPRRTLYRIQAPNRRSWPDKVRAYATRWLEFLTEMPRGRASHGMLPAIVGTVLMTGLMLIVVTPLGVLAALYLQEAPPEQWSTSLSRSFVQSMAGVPSILFGVVGLVFFCHWVGGYLDGGPDRVGLVAWQPTGWLVASGLTCCLGICSLVFATLRSRRRLPSNPRVSWFLKGSSLVCVCLAVDLIVRSPYFHGFYATHPTATYGQGGILWSALTLALLTLPTVIVHSEEALSSVPRSLSDGSYACGAGKWQTLHRVVLPFAAPGIWTGIILAIARGVGLVAPLMLVGVVAATDQLPVDTKFPYLHGHRETMHLSHQIYSLGFESGNPEGMRPTLVAACLLLVAVIASLNLTANYFRNSLRKRIDDGML